MAGADERRRAELIARLQLLGEQEATATALFQQTAAATYDLGITEMRALSVLLREGPRSAGQLAAGLHLTSGAITGVVDRLVRRGFVQRKPDEQDRRKVMVEADEDAIASGDNAYRSIGVAYAELHSTYSLDQLAFLARHLEASIAIVAQETGKLQLGRPPG